jgi:SET domain-containing protein
VFVYAARRIAKGEELTYDYQFPADEAAVPCKCGTANCRGTLNKQ